MSPGTPSTEVALPEIPIQRGGLIRDCTPADAAPISAIYNHYVEETTITLEEALVAADEMAQRIANVTGGFPWLVWEQDGKLLGYAYATQWKARSGYRHSTETTIYLDPQATGKGIGTALYQSLLHKLRSLGAHSAVGGIAVPNRASVALHEKLGFVKIGQFREIGLKFGQWIDVGYWELILAKSNSTHGIPSPRAQGL
jgi:L-amino acid N-acyltransferase YncA